MQGFGEEQRMTPAGTSQQYDFFINEHPVGETVRRNVFCDEADPLTTDVPRSQYCCRKETVPDNGFRISSGTPPSASTSRGMILLVGDDLQFLQSSRRFLESERFATRQCSFESAGSVDVREAFSVILIHLNQYQLFIDEYMDTLHRRFPEVPMIVLDRSGDNDGPRNIPAKYVFSYRFTPCQKTDILHDIELAIKYSNALRENHHLRQSFGVPAHGTGLGVASCLGELHRRQIQMYAKHDTCVLITGEKGTGKGLIAQQIHGAGVRSQGPMIIVACDKLLPRTFDAMLFGYTREAFPEFRGSRVGLLELARGGTIYFDHISEMPLSLQTKLCRILREGKFQRNGSAEFHPLDSRIIAGSRIDLDEACQKRKFSVELLHHFRSATIHLPTLREMRTDIPSLAASLLAGFSKQNRIPLQELSDGAAAKLQRYAWPGNFRELRNVLYWACVNTKGSVIPERSIVFEHSRIGDEELGLAGMTLAEVERRLLIETLTACGGNRAESARRLGLSEKTIYNKFKQYKLKDVV